MQTTLDFDDTIEDDSNDSEDDSFEFFNSTTGTGIDNDAGAVEKEEKKFDTIPDLKRRGQICQSKLHVLIKTKTFFCRKKPVFQFLIFLKYSSCKI